MLTYSVIAFPTAVEVSGFPIAIITLINDLLLVMIIMEVLRTVLSERETRLFLEEAKILSNLSHPHIVRVLEFAVTPRSVKIQNKQLKEMKVSHAPGC